jgi:uncharacterized integral membrane protein
MRRVLAWIVLAPVATIALLFAVANRGWVTVSLDPFSAEAPAYSFELPMFLVMFAALILGVVIGGIAVWFGKMHWRMAAHRAEKELAQLKAEKAAAERHARAETFERRTFPPDARLTSD